jgi:hypothetical protein
MAELMTEEKVRQKMIEGWEKFSIENPELAQKIKREVDGNKDYNHQRNYYEGFLQATDALLPQVLHAPIGGKQVATYMRMYVEWQLDRI